MPSVRVAVAGAMVAAACGRESPTPVPVSAPVSPAAAVVERVAFRVPSDDEIPNDAVGLSIRRGRAILTATRDSLPGNVGSSLRCSSCHVKSGTQANAAPWIGVYSRFPQYRSRNAKVNVIEDRINDCFERSLNGKALELGSPEMADIISYMAFLSRGVGPPGEVEGQGFVRMEPLEPNVDNGRLVYVRKCKVCHGSNGEGAANPEPDGDPKEYPPLWGPRSFTIGAGMARLRTAASFIRHNMPFDKPGTLSDQEAFDVAGYLGTRPRPDFPGKEDDWPKGDPPPDVAYPTKAGPVKKTM
jgi:thiosulfate dehydrogenase